GALKALPELDEALAAGRAVLRPQMVGSIVGLLVNRGVVVQHGLDRRDWASSRRRRRWDRGWRQLGGAGRDAGRGLGRRRGRCRRHAGWRDSCGLSRRGRAGWRLETIGRAGLPEQTNECPRNVQRGGSWPTRPSIDSRMRSAWPLWRAYSSIMLSRM